MCVNSCVHGSRKLKIQHHCGISEQIGIVRSIDKGHHWLYPKAQNHLIHNIVLHHIYKHISASIHCIDYVTLIYLLQLQNNLIASNKIQSQLH